MSDSHSKKHGKKSNLAVLESWEQALTIVDENDNFVYVNPTFAELVGLETSDLLGTSLFDYAFRDDYPELEYQREKYHQGKTTQFSINLRHASGERTPVAITQVPEFKDGQFEGCIFIIQNNARSQSIHTEIQKRDVLLETFHSKLMRQDQLLGGIAASLNILLVQSDLHNAIAKALSKLGVSSGVDRVYLFQLNQEKEELSVSQFESWYKQKELAKDLRKLEPRLPNPKSYYHQLAQGKSYAAVTSQLEPGEERSELETLSIESTLILPVFVDDQLWGIVGFDDCQAPRNWSAYEKSALGAIAAGIGSAVTRHNSKILLQEQKQFYENVLNSIPSDIVVFSPDHRYQFINPVAVPNKELRDWMEGKDDFEYCEFREKPLEIAENRRQEFEECIKGKKTKIWEERLKGKDGETKWVLRHLTPIFDQQDELRMVIGYGLDITAQKQSELKSRSLAKFPEENPHPVFRVSDNGELLYANKAGKPIADNIVREYDLHFKEMVDSAFLYGKVVENEVQIGEKTFSFTFSPIQEFGYVNIYGKDITARLEQEKELIRAREQAEESKRLKQRFLANMSHEIRTPMNGVMGIVHLLQQTQLNANQQAYVKVLNESSEHLMRIINDILDVSKIDEGKLSVISIPFHMQEIVDGVAEQMRRKAEEKKLEFRISGLEIFKQNLRGDPVRIRQILLNLLSNALKYTHSGFVHLSFESLKYEDRKHAFKLDVCDSGIGIDEKYLNSIFEPFEQGDSHTSHKYGGTGLGLSIVKDLVEKMGGHISVSSSPDQGSTFSIELELPCCDEDSKQDELIMMNQRKASLEGYKILLVDDHPVNLDVTTRILSSWGAEIRHAENGLDALSEVMERKPDLVLMDMQMPVMDGLQATAMIRELDDESSLIPIIAMTAAALPEERERCLNSGMNDYISKPIQPGLLYEIVTKFLPSRSSGTPNEKTISEKPKSFTDLSYLADLCEGNFEFMSDMVTSFIREIPEYLEIIRDNISKPEKIKVTAHKAKSMAAYVGCSDMQEAFKNLEYQPELIAEKPELLQELQELYTKSKQSLIQDLNNYEKETARR